MPPSRPKSERKIDEWTDGWKQIDDDAFSIVVFVCHFWSAIREDGTKGFSNFKPQTEKTLISFNDPESDSMRQPRLELAKYTMKARK